MKALALFVLSAAVLSAATRTSTQTGVWSATATWGGSAAPGIGDTAVIATGTVVTADGTTTVGTSGVAGTTAITIQGSGQLTGATGAVLNVRGDISSPVQATTTGAITGSNAWTLNFDTSVVGSSVQYRMKAAGLQAWTFINASNLTMTATAGNFASLDDSDVSQGGMLTCTGCTFQRIRMLPGPNPSVLAPFVLRNTIMDDSSVDVYYTCYGCTITLDRVTWKNSSQDANFRVTTDGTADCTFTHIVSDATWGQNAGAGGGGFAGCQIKDMLARATVLIYGGDSNTLFSNSIFLLSGGKGDNIADGNMAGVWLWVYANDGLHNHLLDLSGTGNNFNYSRVVLHSSVNPQALTAYDGIFDNRSNKTLTFSRGLLLNGPDGRAAASYFEKLGQTATGYKFDHMTVSGCLNDTAAFTIEAEGTTGGFGTSGFLTNSAFWCPTADGQVILNSEIQQNGFSTQVTDPFPPASIHHNGSWNSKTSGVQGTCNIGCVNSNGYQAGIWTGTANATGAVTGSPLFTDYTRTPETWASLYLYPYLGASAPAQWVTSHAYAVGDVVRNTKAGNPYGKEVYFRCVTANTSSGGTEPGSNWTGVTGVASWWTYWKLETVERIADAITAGSTITDPTISCAGCTYIEALTNWVYAGFTPANAAYHAAADGGWIGAVNASPSPSTLAGGKAVVGGSFIAR